MRCYALSLRFCILPVLAACSLRADFLPISQPTATYVNSTTLLDFTDPDYTQLGALYGKGQTLFYDNLVEERTVPLSWNTWGSPPATETATPRVGFTGTSSELTISFLHPVTTFGLELEPNNPFPEQLTAAFYSGSTLEGTISRSPNGTSGALLYAASTTTNPFTSVVINNLQADSFGIARQRYTLAVSTPEPSAFGLAVVALVAGTTLRRRKQRSKSNC